jgi:hypothetical protein
LREFQPVKEYDIFVPLYHNDGSAVEADKFQELQETLLRQFGGLTFFSQPNRGFWRIADVTYHDEIVIYRVIGADAEESRNFLGKLKQRLKADLQQEEILIVERDVQTL